MHMFTFRTDTIFPFRVEFETEVAGFAVFITLVALLTRLRLTIFAGAYMVRHTLALVQVCALRTDTVLSLLIENESIIARGAILLTVFALLTNLRLAIFASTHMIGHTLAEVLMLARWANTILAFLVEDEGVIAGLAILLALVAVLTRLGGAVLACTLMFRHTLAILLVCVGRAYTILPFLIEHEGLIAHFAILLALIALFTRLWRTMFAGTLMIRHALIVLLMCAPRANTFLPVLVQDEALITGRAILLALVAHITILRLPMLAGAHMLRHTLSVLLLGALRADTVLPFIVQHKSRIAGGTVITSEAFLPDFGIPVLAQACCG